MVYRKKEESTKPPKCKQQTISVQNPCFNRSHSSIRRANVSSRDEGLCQHIEIADDLMRMYSRNIASRNRQLGMCLYERRARWRTRALCK